MDFKSIFSRSKQRSEVGKSRNSGKASAAGAHELFLEYEGYLAPAKPRSTRPSTAATRPASRRNSKLHTDTQVSVPHASVLNAERNTKSQPKEPGSSDHKETSQTLPRRIASRRKKSGSPFTHLTRREDSAHPPSNILPLSAPGNGSAGGLTAVNWLRRYITQASIGQPSPPPSFRTTPSYYDPPYYCDENFTALPALPGYEDEAPKSREKEPSETETQAAAAVALTKETFNNLHDPRALASDISRDNESGVGIEVQEHDEASEDFEIPVVRRNPLDALPEELVGHILSFLDAKSLISAELVSRDWRQSAGSHHVWKDVFRAEFQDMCQAASVANAKSAGLGKLIVNQDWKNMWRARKALEQRWKDGHAAAIYLEGHTDSVYCVQFDEDKILTGSRDRTVRIWDARTYECIKVLGAPGRGAGNPLPPLPVDTIEHGRRPFTKVFSPTYNVEPTVTPKSFYHSGSILCLQYDTRIMVTGSSDCSLIIWDVNDNYLPVKRLRRHTAGVLDVCFDSKHIVSCSKDATVCLWDRWTGIFLRRLTGHRGPVNAVQLRGNLVVSASGDGIAKLWNLTSGLCIKEFPSRDRGMACVEFSPDSRTILAGGNDQVIYQFDTITGELVREMKGHENLVRSLHLDSSSSRVVSGSYDTSVRAFDLQTGQPIVNFTKWTSSWILSAKSDYRRIIATSQDSRAVIIDFGYRLQGIELLES